MAMEVVICQVKPLQGNWKEDTISPVTTPIIIPRTDGIKQHHPLRARGLAITIRMEM
jgi:hypothetical protein